MKTSNDLDLNLSADLPAGSVMDGWRRTHYCGAIAEGTPPFEATINGWVQKARVLGGLAFVLVRDRTGIAQVVFEADENAGDGADPLFEAARKLRQEFVIAVRGRVRMRSPESVNPNMRTGGREIVATELRVFNKSETPPIYIEENLDVNEATRLKYRYLDLRRPDLQRNLMLRHRAAKAARDYFDECGFLEIETPMLTKSTPEGARDYLVPSRVYPGQFFALPQSPQLFKQLFMVAGYDRYMQIARCFRDEDLRADRQPEFTQIDAEMSFVDVDDVIEINEGFIKRLFKDTIGCDVKTPFLRMTYADAMLRYGSDKPDLRPGMEISDLTPMFAGSGFAAFDGAIAAGGAVRALVAKGCAGFSRKEIDALAAEARSRGAGGLAWTAIPDGGGDGGVDIRSSFAKFLPQGLMTAALEALGAEPGDLALFVADASRDTAATALGHVRLEIAKKRGLLRKDEYAFLWVTEFPLLERDDEAGRWVAKHHPFTSPMDEDIPLLDTDPAAVRAKAYDVIINGMEAGGGSIRINTQVMQEKIFSALGFTPEEARERFSFLLDAFRYGAPPHGGIAYGLDRLVMALAGCDSIKDVIAFPKVQTSSCLMTGAPSAAEPSQLAELGISLSE